MKNIVFLNRFNAGVIAWRYQSWVYQSVQRLQKQVEFQQISFPVTDVNWIRSVDVFCFNCMYDSNTIGYMRWVKEINPNVKIYWFADDLALYDYIPNYLAQKILFKDWSDSTKEIINFVDKIITTTEVLKNRFIDIGGLDNGDKIICLPNLLPTIWLPTKVNLERKIERFKMIKNGKLKPRIAVAMLANHLNINRNMRSDGQLYIGQNDKEYYDLENDLNIPKSLLPDNCEVIDDDSSLIVDCVRQTCDLYEWIFIGNIPDGLSDLAKAGKLKQIGSLSITSYIKTLNELDLDLAVVPLLDNDFNRCKSPIKVLEYYSVGVPCFVSDVGVYDGLCQNNDFKFKGNFSKDKLMEYFNKSSNYVHSTIQNQVDNLQSTFELDGRTWKSYIMEHNLSQIDEIIIGE